MPDLDVSFMLSDPMLSETVTVTRRLDAISTKGRTQKTVEQVFDDVVGVITQSDPSDLIRGEQGQLLPRVITFCTTFAIRGPSVDRTTGVKYQPDVITWNGNDYVVIGFSPYPSFGQGVYEVTAQSTASVDAIQ